MTGAAENIVVIGCPNCGRQYRYDTGRYGTTGVRIRCRSCDNVMRVEIPRNLLEGASATAGPGSPPSAHEVGAQEPPDRRQAPLPAPPEPAAPVPAPAPPRLALVAEGDPRRRLLLTGLLRERGYQVEETDDGEVARNLLLNGEVCLAVMDVYLKHRLGVSLCVEMKQNELRCPIVLMGAHYPRDRFVRDPEDLYGCDAFLDGHGPEDEVRRRACEALDAVEERLERKAGRPEAAEDLERLARIVVSDIILYNPGRAEAEIDAGRFLETFAAEIHEGELLVQERFGHLEGGLEAFRERVQDALDRRAVVPVGRRPVGT